MTEIENQIMNVIIKEVRRAPLTTLPLIYSKLVHCSVCPYREDCRPRTKMGTLLDGSLLEPACISFIRDKLAQGIADQCAKRIFECDERK